MTNLLNRLGSLGLLVAASALLLGGLAGAAVAHHYDRLSSSPAAAQQDGQGNGANKPKHQHRLPHPGNGGHQSGASGNDPTETD